MRASLLSLMLVLALVALVCFPSAASAASPVRSHPRPARRAQSGLPLQQPHIIPTPKNLQFDDPSAAANWTALQEYVAAPDGNYSWTHVAQFDTAGMGYKVMYLNMTSQGWLSAEESNRPIWWHWMAIIIPSTINSTFKNRAVLYITGGNNEDASPENLLGEDMLVGATLATSCQTLTVVLFQVPNAPVKYWGEQPVPKNRVEDAIIAYGWSQYLLNPDQPQWLLRLPMTKAAVRAMDAATEFWQQQSTNVVSKWIVAGASKRGWTTWTVGAVDPTRVVAIVPMVLDELNFVKNMHHHWRAYGGWSFALADYLKQNLTQQFDSPNFAKAMSIVDPIVYADILTMPKLIISTGGDEFLMPDNNDYYWPQLQGEKHFHQFPNLEHTMAGNIPLVLDTVAGFVLQQQTGNAAPSYSWTKEADGTLTVQVATTNPPSSIQLWQAFTIDGPLRRDFRMLALSNATSKPDLHWVPWNGTDIQPNAALSSRETLVYQVKADPPVGTGGWVAFNVQLVFPGVMNSHFRVSTATSILPQVFPFPDCYAETCIGTQV